MPRKCAAVSIWQHADGRFLVVWNKRYNGWTFPGGLVEDGERTIEAQARELREETGLEVASARLIYHADAMELAEHQDRATYVYVYAVQALGEPKEMEPGCPVKWMTRAEFLASSPFAEFYRKMWRFMGEADSP